MNYLDLTSFLKLKKVNKNQFLEHLSGDLKCEYYITGSVIFGHGTPTSDIDVIILSEENFQGIKVKNTYSMGIRVDAEIISITTIKKYMEYLESYETFSESSDFYSKKINDCKCVDISEVVGRCLGGLKANRKVEQDMVLEDFDWRPMYSWLRNYYCWKVHCMIEDITGFISAKDYLAAYSSTLEALHYCLMSMLNKEGIYIDRIKWLPYILKNERVEFYSLYYNYINSSPSIDLINEYLDEMERLCFDV